jgi:hypothetical protein
MMMAKIAKAERKWIYVDLHGMPRPRGGLKNRLNPLKTM